MIALLPSEVSRLRNASVPREFGAVLHEVETRLGCEVTARDLEEVALGHHGRTAEHKTATFERQLPGWGELDGSFKGACDVARAIAQMGYEVPS